jgi:hypothetical protein
MTLVDSINDPNYILFTSSLISVISSILILRYISTNKRLERMYNRLVFMLALVDLIYTFHLNIFSITIRKKNRQVDSLCNYEGFIHTAMVMPSMYYNAFLSVFFLYSICYSDKKALLKRLEPYIHCLCILIPIIVATLNLALGVYGPGNPDKYSCYVIIPNDPPLKCDGNGNCFNPYDDSTLRAAYLLSWFQIFSGIATFLLLSMNSYLIFHKAQALSKANEKHALEISNATESVSSSHRKLTKQLPPGRKNVIQIRNQSFLYVGGFIMIYLTVLTLNIACAINPKKWGPFVDYLAADIVRLLFDIFYPLSGLYTALVFFRPRFLRWRDLNRSRSWFFILRRTIFSSAAPYSVSLDPGAGERRHSRIRRLTFSFQRSTGDVDRSDFDLGPEKNHDEEEIKV